MRTYEFRIEWEGSYPPHGLTCMYVEVGRMSPYRIKWQGDSCKGALAAATQYINNHIADNPKKFELIPI